MATKEKTGILTFPRRDRVSLSRRALVAGAETGVCFLLGGVLAGAEIFSLYAPFGVAAVAAAGSGFTGLAALAGSCLGYLCLEGMTDGMRYAASAILVYSVAFAFYDTKVYRRPWFMPGIAAVLTAATGMICRGGQGWHGEDLVYFVTEVLFTAVAAYLYTVIFDQWPDTLEGLKTLSPRQSAGLLMLASTVLMALARVELLETFSLGRLLAGLVVMTAARRGVGEGVMVGACAGVALDLASAQAPYDSMIFTLAGLACGLCRERGKLLAALAYVAASSVAVLWTWEGGVRWGMPLEAVVGAGIFLLLPLPKKRARQKDSGKAPADQPGQRAELQGALGKLEDLAGAFHNLAGSVKSTLRPEQPNGENPGEIFTRAADKVCAKCVLGPTCWQKEYEATKDAMNNATGSVLERGRALATDFPGQFSHRCVHFPDFLGEVNRELTGFLRRRQNRRRSEETRQVLLSHYSRLDALLSKAAAELSASLTPDLPRQAKLEAYLQSMNQKGGAVYYDAKGRLRAETPITAELKTAAVRRELGQVLGTPLREGEEKGGRLLFTQAEPFKVTAAVAGAPKGGEQVSGDTGTWFRREDGVLFLLLCDGMGSGPGAKEESARAAGLIEDFLRAGLAEEETLEAVASAMALRGEPFGSATVDLLAVDLFTGRCKLYKQGAAPTYLRRKGRVEKASARSLPAGIATGEGARPHVREFRGQAGDWLVLVTDGILCGREDTWLRTLLAGHQGTSPGELAQVILRQSQDLHRGEDDSTVIAVRLEQSREVTRNQHQPKDRPREKRAALR